MDKTIKFEAEIKSNSGTGVARKFRRSGKLPAIIYGGAENKMISLVEKDFVKEYKKGNLCRKITKLILEGQEITVLPSDVQTHPVTDKPMHIDFREVASDTVIKTKLHIKVINKDKCPGIKRGGLINIAKRYINIKCRPGDMIEHLDIDVNGLNIGDSLHINDLTFPDGIEVLDNKNNQVVIAITGRVKEEEDSATTDTAAATTTEQKS